MSSQTLKQTIQDDLRTAMRARDQVRTSTLRMVLTAISTAEVAGTEGADQLLGLFSLGRVLSFSVILALVNIVLMTALSTLFAFLYNIGSSIVGGFHLTLTDD